MMVEALPSSCTFNVVMYRATDPKIHYLFHSEQKVSA